MLPAPLFDGGAPSARRVAIVLLPANNMSFRLCARLVKKFAARTTATRIRRGPIGGDGRFSPRLDTLRSVQLSRSSRNHNIPQNGDALPYRTFPYRTLRGGSKASGDYP